MPKGILRILDVSGEFELAKLCQNQEKGIMGICVASGTNPVLSSVSHVKYPGEVNRKYTLKHMGNRDTKKVNDMTLVLASQSISGVKLYELISNNDEIIFP